MKRFFLFNSLNASLFAIILFKKIVAKLVFTSSAFDSPIVSKWIYIRYFPSHADKDSLLDSKMMIAHLQS
jgi:hypothetical protein